VPLSQNSPEKKYWAFISYSSTDKKWGKWLHHRLENYPIPKEFQDPELFDGAILGKNLSPIFRDRDELAGSAELGPAILKGLQQSRFLIVLCSPNSAKSKWVNKEIEDFVALDPGNHRRILALILNGEPNATSNPSANHARECFPPALRHPAEPLAGDLRKEGDGKQRGFLKILAGISQLDFDTLYRRHERALQRRRRNLALLALGVILSLAGLTYFAFVQKEHANLANAEAEQHSRTAERQRELADESAQTAERALSLSQQELYRARISEANMALMNGNTLDSLQALATCPLDLCSWEWHYLIHLVGPAPLTIHSDDLALLDQGALRGSGLLQDARKVIDDDECINPFPSPDTSLICTLDHGTDRGGARLFFSSATDEKELPHYRFGGHGGFNNARFSTDGTCLIVLGPPPPCTVRHRRADRPQSSGPRRDFHLHSSRPDHRGYRCSRVYPPEEVSPTFAPCAPRQYSDKSKPRPRSGEIRHRQSSGLA